ncbi:hypothetical protein CES85_3428 (plasmid) [Ochrobactrum quorumnocens]|uniref:Uncharacterized protein n=1 Tax=Ochrobactrum quorumnocens TaxID=271865 RepID=A0A248ULQ9_9HYPH|nr:hypothetical protein CES85_3428 [[Ochrobactrum] quorumnocens]
MKAAARKRTSGAFAQFKTRLTVSYSEIDLDREVHIHLCADRSHYRSYLTKTTSGR